ncbi:MAG: TonB family protein [Sporomusaceae bacterium]|nr:TonB family protein [Sporomusaceae bacterium]
MKKTIGLGIVIFLSIFLMNLPATYAATASSRLNHIVPPKFLSQEAPVYPLAARLYNITGTVSLRIRIHTDGSVGEVTIRKSSGYKILDEAAVDVARTWQFIPATDREGVPVESFVLQPVSFRLSDNRYAIIKSVIDSWDPEKLNPYLNPETYNGDIYHIYAQMNQFALDESELSYTALIDAIETVDQSKQYTRNVYRAIARKIIKKYYPERDTTRQFDRGAENLDPESHYRTVIAYYTKAIEDEPYDVDYYNQRAFAYFYLHDYLGAIRDYSEVIQLEPTYYQHYKNRAESYFWMHDYPNAIRDYDKIIELQPANGDNFYNRGRIFSKLQDQAKAIDDFSSAIRLNPDDYRYYVVRGSAYHASQNYKAAVSDYRMASQIAPHAPGMGAVYYDRGEAYLALHDYQNALDSYSRAIAASPQRENYYNARGKLYLKLKEYEKAVADFSQAIDKLGNNPVDSAQKAGYYFARADAYQMLGQSDQSNNDRQQAIKLMSIPD